MTHSRAVFHLKLACAICIATGLIVPLSLAANTFGPLSWFMDLAHLPLDSTQSFGTDSELLLGAISGGLLVGLGVMAHQVTTHVYTSDPHTGGHILRVGIWAWFIVDSTGSVLSGAWFNVVMNGAFLAMFLVPILLANRHQTATA